MYQSYFGLKEQAFSIAVDPRYLYMSRQHQEALAHLLYGVQGGGFVMLSGEVGTGKTTIVKQLLSKLPKDTDIAIILNPMSNVIELLSTICDELGVSYYADDITIKMLTDALYDFLLTNHSTGRNTVLLIDEAQLLSPDVLEQLRLLTNLETSAKKLLQIILVGQPELNSLLAQPRLRQLSQRITARFHLKPLSAAETYAYIRHRLYVAGMPPDRDPFSDNIIKLVHEFTGGIPRRINVLCERLLIGAFGQSKSKIDKTIFEAAKSEVTYNVAEQPLHTHKYFLIPAAVGLCCIIFTALSMWVLMPSSTPSSPSHAVNIVSEPVKLPPKNTNQNAIHLDAPYVFDRMAAAQTDLFSHLNIIDKQTPNPCWSINSRYSCSKQKVSSWTELREVNRPAIITLDLPGKIRGYALVTAISTSYAQLSYFSQTGITYTKMPLVELGEKWTGDFLYVWYKPEGFTGQLVIGQNNPAVEFVAQQFAKIDQRSKPLTQNQFNDSLEKRVKIFQREYGLKSDGIVGKATLLKLNEVVQLDRTLNQI